jgi:hypothetical protein
MFPTAFDTDSLPYVDRHGFLKGVCKGTLLLHPSKEKSMTRTLKALSALVLGGIFLVSSTACEDKVCQEALAKATTAADQAAKAQVAAAAELTQTKARLAAAEAALAAAKKDLETAKAAPKPEEAAPPAAAAKKGKGKGKKK